MKRKLLLIDVETGGLDPTEHSLLSICALVWFDGSVHGELYMRIAEEHIVATDEALAVNGLSVEELQKDGLTPFEAMLHLENFILLHDMRGKVTLAGHGVSFDVGFLRRMYRLAAGDYDSRFSHRVLCTHSGALLLDQVGVINLPGGSASLETLAEMWDIPLDRTVGHHAAGDAIATVSVLNRILSYMKGASSGTSPATVGRAPSNASE